MPLLVGRSVPLSDPSLGIVFVVKAPETGYVVSVKGVEVDVTAIAAPLRQLGTSWHRELTGTRLKFSNGSALAFLNVWSSDFAAG